MSNAKFDEGSQYFSGQGVALLGVVSATKVLLGYEPLGNVTDLKLSINTNVIEQKNSQDGQRGIDKRLQTETNVKLMMTLKSYKLNNLTRALRGASTKVAAATAAAYALSLAPGLVMGFGKVSVSGITVLANAVALTDYVADGTPWDYRTNSDAGSIQLNNGSSGTYPDKLGAIPSAVTVGATTTITVTNTFAIGEEVALWGFTGADAALVNNKTFVAITGTNATTLVIALVTTAKVITTAVGTRAMSLTAPVAITGVFNYAAQVVVEALTTPLTEIPMRFEGLNTASDNTPVVVEVWRFSTDPLKELALITDTFGEIQLEGSVLADSTKTSGSKFFRVTKLNV